MPIHDLGYRAWQGAVVPEVLRFWAITATGVRLAWNNRWLRRLLLTAWLPALYFSAGFFIYEQWLTRAGSIHAVQNFLGGLPATTDRHVVWSFLLWLFFRNAQTLIVVLMVGMIAPPLIAQDVRTRAFLLYFSRPITRLEYLAGKVLVLWTYLILITTLPALLLYLIAIFLSPDISVVRSTWDLPLRVIAASAVLIIPTTSIALAFSSLTSDTRYATFAWFAVWAVGWVTYAVSTAALLERPHDGWTLVSLYHTLGVVQNWIFGIRFPGATRAVVPAALALTGLTIMSLVVLVRRVSSPMRL